MNVMPATALSTHMGIETFEGFYQALDPVAVLVELSRLPFFKSDDICLELSEIRLSRHKPGRRCLIEYDVVLKHASRLPQSMTLMGKVRFKSHDKKSWALVNELWRCGFDERANDEIMLPQPVGEIPHWHMCLQAKVPGAGLDQLLASSRGEQLAVRVAEAAHKIHHRVVTTHRRHTMADELHILNKGLTSTASRYPQWSNRIERILKRCENLGRSLPLARSCGIHRDFYAEQIIADGERLYLLDFDLYCEGDPALDIGNFIAHIVEYSLRILGDRKALEHVEKALEKRFLQLNPNIAEQAIFGYVTLSLARHIHISTLFDERRPFTQKILALTEHRLGI